MRKLKSKNGKTYLQVVDKSSGKYKVLKSFGGADSEQKLNQTEVKEESVSGLRTSQLTEKMSSEDFEKIILSKERQAAGASAPAHALFLSKINYPYIT